MSDPEPYKKTPIFDAETLPDAIRKAHSTKAGVWGLLRVLQGSVDLVFHSPHAVREVTPNNPAQINPEDVHHVEVGGPMQMQVEFYREPPLTV
ncbi:DUF1971 domain-containing protein [Novosphingobium sp. RL4]|uniref:DUF1971 domain-containing protein n=1 Tax=Novosphingobium sp. RL4 TaxID=3109595 RepID=UPI002D781CDD|nr:DUF1971 domain-containing protein [Novosphingobium sp. RL4]WRT94474.1 DUF1971 domain-containing protein [Novosphingobium sp. RL4]